MTIEDLQRKRSMNATSIRDNVLQRPPRWPGRGAGPGRRAGYQLSDKQVPRVPPLSEAGYSQRRIVGGLSLSKTTVNEILKRYRAQEAESSDA